MRTSILTGILAGLGLALAGSTSALSAQVPTRTIEPKLAAPRGVTPSQLPPGQPTTAAAPDTSAPAASAPAPVTQVTGPSGGVTTIPASPPPETASSAQAATAAGYSSDKRGYAAGKFALTLEGTMVGWMKSTGGGTAAGEVVTEKLGPGGAAKKHLAGVKYENVSLTNGLDSKFLNDWIADTWSGKGARKNGSVVAANYDYRAVSELQFFNGLIVATTFPTLDASSKDAAWITVEIAPEYTRMLNGSGATLPKTLDAKAQKRWLPSNFRFTMDGLETGSSRVNHIESFTVGANSADHPVGELRDYEKEPAGLEFPNLKLTLPESYAGDWVKWHDDFVIKGNNDDEKEKNGSIVYLDANRQTELARINLFNCGIYRLSPQKVEAGSESIRRLEAELYCERMTFEGKAAAQ